MKTILILALMLGAITAKARLGESEEQLTNRYGAVIQVRTNDGLRTLTFNFGEYLVQSRLSGGRSVVEFAYLKKKGVEFQEQDALAIAEKMAGVKSLVMKDSSLWQKTYSAPNMTLFVQFNNPPGRPQSVMVTTIQQLQRSLKTDPSKSAANGF